MNEKINDFIKTENPKIRVLFLITQSEFGGAQRFVDELATGLDKEKYEILVAAGPAARKNYEFLDELEKIGIKIRRLNNLQREINLIRDLAAIFEIRKLIKNWGPNVVFLNSSKAGFIGSIASKFYFLNSKFSVIYRIGGWSFNDPWPNWKKRLFLSAEKITAKFKDIIIVNNKSDFEQAVKLKIKPKKELKLIYNGIDALKIDFLPKDEALLKLFKKSPKIFQANFIIGTIANLYPTKGLPYLIKAARILKENFEKEGVKFVIIGDGKERKNIERLIEETGLKNEVILAGQIPEASKYIKAFDVFALPSVKEGFPWVILEAMAAKIPVVATNVGALPEIIESGKNGILVEPGNPKQIAEAVKYLLGNERACQEMTLQAHQTVLFKFPVEKMIKETEILWNYLEET